MDKTIKYVGIGIIGLYALSKLNIAKGAGNLAGDLGGGIVSGVAGVIGGIAGSVVDQVKTGIVKPIADNIDKNVYANVSGHGNFWSGFQVGVNPLAWAPAIAAYRLPQHLQPNADAIIGDSGYDTPSGLTYIAPERQKEAAGIQQMIRSGIYSPAEIAYIDAVNAGKDVSTWGWYSDYGSPGQISHTKEFWNLYPNVSMRVIS